MAQVERQERGWPGHYILADRCLFRRNTLLTLGETRIVVSTVGNQVSRDGHTIETVGTGRHFETAAFHAEHTQGRWWDVDVNRQVSIQGACAIAEQDADDRANDMHEAVTTEISLRMLGGDIR